MIPGSCTVSRSSRIQAGIPCPGSSSPERGLDSESASGSAFSEDMGGAGITGDTTGTAEQRSTTTTPTSLTAERSSIATTSIAATSTMATRSREADLAAEVRGSTGLRRLTFSQEHARAHSVALITAETSEAFPPAGGQALEVAPVEAVFMPAVVDDIGDRLYACVKLVENSKTERKTMLHRISIFVQLECQGFVRFAVSILFALSLGCSPAPMFAQEPGQRTFASAEDAASALFAAMQVQDEQFSLSILGPAGKDVISSGDPVEDSDTRASFVVKYQEMHRFVTEANGTITLVVGAENWPFPIPLVRNNGSWYFDTA